MQQRKFYPPNSLPAALNFFTTASYDPSDPMDRPPFPIIIADPLFREVVENLNYGDLGLFLLVSVATTGMAFVGVKLPSMSHPVLRRDYSEFLTLRGRFFRLLAVTLLSMNVIWPLTFSFHRLKGFKHNGLQWLNVRPPKNHFAKKKFDYSVWSKLF